VWLASLLTASPAYGCPGPGGGRCGAVQRDGGGSVAQCWSRHRLARPPAPLINGGGGATAGAVASLTRVKGLVTGGPIKLSNRHPGPWEASPIRRICYPCPIVCNVKYLTLHGSARLHCELPRLSLAPTEPGPRSVRPSESESWTPASPPQRPFEPFQQHFLNFIKKQKRYKCNSKLQNDIILI
jgi:hypothetical protein